MRRPARWAPYPPPPTPGTMEAQKPKTKPHPHARPVRGEHPSDEPAARPEHAALARLAHVALARRAAGRVDARGVGEEEADALATERAEPLLVGDLPVRRGRVELEIAGVQHEPGGRVDGERGRVGDRVRDPHRLDVEGPDAVARPGARDPEVELARLVAVLVQPLARELERVRGAPDGHVAPIEQVGQAPDVVLVPVGEHHAADPVAPLEQVVETRVEDVDPEIAGGERDAAVDEHHLAVLLEGEAVHADLSEPAQGHEPERASFRLHAQRKAPPTMVRARARGGRV